MKVYHITYRFETGLTSGITSHLGSFICLHSERWQLIDEIVEDMNSKYPNKMARKDFKTSNSTITGQLCESLLENNPEYFI